MKNFIDMKLLKIAASITISCLLPISHAFGQDATRPGNDAPQYKIPIDLPGSGSNDDLSGRKKEITKALGRALWDDYLRLMSPDGKKPFEELLKKNPDKAYIALGEVHTLQMQELQTLFKKEDNWCLSLPNSALAGSVECLAQHGIGRTGYCEYHAWGMVLKQFGADHPAVGFEALGGYGGRYEAVRKILNKCDDEDNKKQLSGVGQTAQKSDATINENRLKTAVSEDVISAKTPMLAERQYSIPAGKSKSSTLSKEPQVKPLSENKPSGTVDAVKTTVDKSVVTETIGDTTEAPSGEDREWLEKKEEELSERILREMARKNERLMENSDADTSSYDNEIKQLKKRLKSVKEELQGNPPSNKAATTSKETDDMKKLDEMFKRLKDDTQKIIQGYRKKTGRTIHTPPSITPKGDDKTARKPTEIKDEYGYITEEHGEKSAKLENEPSQKSKKSVGSSKALSEISVKPIVDLPDSDVELAQLPPKTHTDKTKNIEALWSITWKGDDASNGPLRVMITGGHITGRYNAADNGRLYLDEQQGIITGYWVENASDQPCGAKYQGSSHWGRIKVKLNQSGDKYIGSWGYCDNSNRYTLVITRSAMAVKIEDISDIPAQGEGPYGLMEEKGEQSKATARATEATKLDANRWAMILVPPPDPLQQLSYEFHTFANEAQEAAVVEASMLIFREISGYGPSQEKVDKSNSAVTNLAIRTASLWKKDLTAEQQHDLGRAFEKLPPNLQEVYAREFMMTTAINLMMNVMKVGQSVQAKTGSE